eukprot:4036521-Pyramimonas_sp.AAC.1
MSGNIQHWHRREECTGILRKGRGSYRGRSNLEPLEAGSSNGECDGQLGDKGDRGKDGLPGWAKRGGVRRNSGG